MKKCCHLVAPLGSNNFKPVKMGTYYASGLQGMQGINTCFQQMTLGKPWKKNSKPGNWSRSQPWEVSFTHTLSK